MLAGVLLRVVGVGKYVVWDGVGARVFSMSAGLPVPFSFPFLLQKICLCITCGLLSTARLHFLIYLYLVWLRSSIYLTSFSHLFGSLFIRMSLYQTLRGILLLHPSTYIPTIHFTLTATLAMTQVRSNSRANRRVSGDSKASTLLFAHSPTQLRSTWNLKLPRDAKRHHCRINDEDTTEENKDSSHTTSKTGSFLNGIPPWRLTHSEDREDLPPFQGPPSTLDPGTWSSQILACRSRGMAYRRLGLVINQHP